MSLPPTFSQATLHLLRTIAADPSLLLKSGSPETHALLNSQKNKKAQGTGNKVTDQEAAFADLLNQHGFTFLAKSAAPTTGFYYIYQPGGCQRNDDFHLLEVVDGATKRCHVIDLKHTGNKIFFLNDGWFNKSTIYVISWNAGTKKKPQFRTHIALGEDIPTEEEAAQMSLLKQLKTTSNSGTKKVGSLHCYVRFANRYSCQRFTPEVAATQLKAVEAMAHTS
jgi:hypothetical protein